MTSDSTPAFEIEKEALKTEIETGIQAGVDHLEAKTTKRKDADKYHNTRHLLKQYRKVAYAIQISEADMNVRMEMEHGTRLSTLEVNAELAGVDLSGSKLEGYARTVIRSKNMLQIIDNALNTVRMDPDHGELMYQVLYLTYFSKKKPANREVILSELDRQGFPMSMVSNSGSYGTASFMSPKEASACFEVTSAKRTSQDILGMLPDGQVLTLPKDTRLNANLAVCGSSGTGKSRAISRNLVLQAVKRGESVILTDPKSELYESMGEYLRENGYIVKVFNLVEMDHSDSWNCLGEVGSSELMAQTFADIVLQNTSGDSKDAFWYNAELNLLKALVLYVALEMPPEKRNIATVYDLLYTQTEKGLSDMMASISHEHANQYTGELLPPSPASAPYAIFRQSSETVRTSVIIGLGSKLAVLQAQQVRNITSYNEIDLELPGKQKCAYFCIVSDQDSTYDFLSSLFFSFLFIRLIRYADAYCEGGMLHPKVKFILDEFPNCCLIPDFTKKCSTIRSRGCSVAVFFQNVGQMRNRYPDDQWQEILGACDSTVFLGCTDMLTAEYFSDRIGTASVEVEGTMRELNTMHITDYTPRFRKTNSLGRRPLLTPDEVLRLPPDQVLIFIRGQKVMRAKRFDYSLHPDYKKLKSRKAILHEPDWKSSQASSVSASGVSSPSVTAAIPAEKANVGSQKKPPGKPPRSTTRKVVNADELF